jgi:hypothetical protein
MDIPDVGFVIHFDHHAQLSILQSQLSLGCVCQEGIRFVIMSEQAGWSAEELFHTPSRKNSSEEQVYAHTNKLPALGGVYFCVWP